MSIYWMRTVDVYPDGDHDTFFMAWSLVEAGEIDEILQAMREISVALDLDIDDLAPPLMGSICE
jgi:hypothetical protein